VNIEYVYAFMAKREGSAMVVLRVEGGRETEVADVLAEAGYELLTAEEAHSF